MCRKPTRWAGHHVHHPPLTRTAIELGSERVANIVALGALTELGKFCDRMSIEAAVRAETPKVYLDLNMDALAAGYKMAAGVAMSHT